MRPLSCLEAEEDDGTVFSVQVFQGLVLAATNFYQQPVDARDAIKSRVIRVSFFIRT